METPMPPKLAAAFVKAQATFEGAIKDSMNPHFKSKYADLESVFKAVQDGLKANKIALLQRGVPAPHGFAAIETVLVHESGETYSCGVMQAPLPKQDPQGFGSAVTYLRRYGLQAACGIPAIDDDGNAASIPPSAQTTAKSGSGETPQSANVTAIREVFEVASPANVAAIRKALMESGRNEAALLHHLKTSAASLDLITPADAERAAKSLGITLPESETPESAPAATAKVVNKFNF